MRSVGRSSVLENPNDSNWLAGVFIHQHSFVTVGSRISEALAAYPDWFLLSQTPVPHCPSRTGATSRTVDRNDEGCKVNLTVASRADLDGVVTLVNDAYRGSSKQPGWTHEMTLLAGKRVDSASLSAMIEKDRATILVMRDGRDGVGCVALQPVDRVEWYLSMLAVDPDRQADGLGKSIMAGAEKFASERGAQRIKISVINLRASLIAWYERQGYIRTGAVEPFPYEDPTVGRPLRDDLSLITLTKSLQSPAA